RVFVVDFLRCIRRRRVYFGGPADERLPLVAPRVLQLRRKEAETIAIPRRQLSTDSKESLVEISDICRDLGEALGDLLLRLLRRDVLEESWPDKISKCSALPLSAGRRFRMRDLLESPWILEGRFSLGRRQLPPMTNEIENVFPLEPSIPFTGADVDDA